MFREKCLYVCISECREIVKVGSTSNLKDRVSGLCTQEKKNFSLIFYSVFMDKNTALTVERAVTSKFKNYLIKGKEWYKINPLEIILYLTKELSIRNGTVKPEPKYECWESNLGAYKTTPKLEGTNIRFMVKEGLSYVRVLSDGYFKHYCFSNTGDARRFYTRYSYASDAAENLIENIYGENKPYNLFRYNKNIYSYVHSN